MVDGAKQGIQMLADRVLVAVPKADGERTSNVGEFGAVAGTTTPSQKRTWNGREGSTRSSS